MRVLVLGVSGMLGNAMFRFIGAKGVHKVFGTVRSSTNSLFFAKNDQDHIIKNVDVENYDSLTQLFSKVKPDVVVNCVGLIKQLSNADDPLVALPINSLLPHRLAKLCEVSGSRLIHVSTDCVFSGKVGNYRENDISDAEDLYGKSKYIGEVSYPHTITLRTSIIGHELASSNGLIGWFLTQEGRVRGYAKAIFSGLPTIELARVVSDVVLPRHDLSGLYHVSSNPISKYELLKLVAKIYNKKIEIDKDDEFEINRSLNSDRFFEATGYRSPEWPELVKRMYEFK